MISINFDAVGKTLLHLKFVDCDIGTDRQDEIIRVPFFTTAKES